MTDDATTRWFIVCDCAGHPEELVGVVDVSSAGEARVWHTGRSGGGLSLTGANRLLLNTPAAERSDLARKLKAREIPLSLVVSFLHAPCGLNLRVSEARLGELVSLVSKAVEDQCIPLALLVRVNGKIQGGQTR